MRPVNRRMKPLDTRLPVPALSRLGSGRLPDRVRPGAFCPREVLRAPALPQPGLVSRWPPGATAPTWSTSTPRPGPWSWPRWTAATPPAYLDRVTDLPEQDLLLGAHLLFADGRQPSPAVPGPAVRRQPAAQVRPKERAAEAALIDVLPGSGKPVAAFALATESLDVFLERDQALYREGPQARAGAQPLSAEPARRAVSPRTGSRASRCSTRPRAACCCSSSRTGAGITGGGALRGGAGQRSTRRDASRSGLRPAHLRILLFESANPADGFSVRPVTLSRDTSSLALVGCAGGPGFLFNEISARGEPRYLISLLYSSARQGVRQERSFTAPHAPPPRCEQCQARGALRGLLRRDPARPASRLCRAGKR